MICIIDYKIGNILSVKNALLKARLNCIVSNSHFEIKKAEALILPGVGSFQKGMKNLKDLNLIEILNEEVLVKKKKILGICLGFQLMANKSTEHGNNKGLGWIDCNVEKIKTINLRLPHVGWNNVVIHSKNNILLKDLENKLLFYFNHSYCIEKIKDKNFQTILTCKYGTNFITLGKKFNIIGIQPHPEKSQLNGIKFLKNCFKN